MRNSDDALLNALNKSTFLYQADTAEAITSLRNWSIALMITPLASLLFVVIALVRPTVRTIEDNKLAVLRLFLDIPVQLVFVFRSRIARRLAAIENSEDGAFGKNGAKIANGDDEVQVQEEDEADIIDKVLQQIRLDNQPAAPFSQQVAVSTGQEGSTERDMKVSKSSKDRDSERRHRQAKADESDSVNHFFRRNLTMIKISAYILCAFLYFIITYELFFEQEKTSWMSKPFQVRIAAPFALDSPK